MHKSIVIDRVCRIEGHGGITVNIKDGKVAEVKMDVFEGTASSSRWLSAGPTVKSHRY